MSKKTSFETREGIYAKVLLEECERDRKEIKFRPTCKGITMWSRVRLEKLIVVQLIRHLLQWMNPDGLLFCL